MSKMVQIRNMPDGIHRALKSRAAAAGLSLSEYLLREAKRIAARPTLIDVLERLEERDPAEVTEDSVAAVRAERKLRHDRT